jgi:DNA/RNA-binding domain of Phe-tRNA-synthetase-like protein
MNFSIDPRVSALGIDVVLVLGERLSVQRSIEALEMEKKRVTQEIKARWSSESVENNPILNGFKTLYSVVGEDPNKLTPSARYLIEYIWKNKRFLTVNTAVDSYNMISATSLLSLGAHDTSKLGDDFRLAMTDGSEVFIPLGERSPEKVRPGRYAYMTGNQIICWLDVRQGESTKVTLGTKSIVVIVEGNKTVDNSYLRETADRVCENLPRYCGGRAKIIWPI